MEKERLEYLDFLRVYFCFAIFAYHIGVLKGGYLAVCSFLALSGYLSASYFRKDSIKIAAYYKSRFFRVYMPMLLVVFCSLVLCMLLLPDLLWISMKREVASIVLGYNNFWQLSANLDYFSRHVDSPYMHLWYVAILLQIELVFPLIFGFLKHIIGKIGKYANAALCLIVGVVSMVWFVYLNNTEGLMYAYYNTLSRCFAWFMGLAIGLFHNTHRPLILKPIVKGFVSKLILYGLMLVQFVLFVIVGAGSELYTVAMLVTTVLTCRMLDYAKVIEQKMSSLSGRIIRFFSNISYEVFLVQYPVIYMLQYLEVSKALRYALTIIITFGSAVLVNLAVRHKRGSRPLVVLAIEYMLVILLIAGAGYGGYRYVIAPDIQTEQERLEEELARQEEEQRRKQEEYEAKLKAEEEKRKKEEEEQKKREEELRRQLEEAKADIDKQLEIIEEQKLEIKENIPNLSITFVGDSVLLGASDTLYQDFPNCYVDAKISRTAYVINSIFVDLKNRGILGDTIIINCGANGDCSEACKNEIMATLEDRQVFWLTCTNNAKANTTLFEYAERYDNLHVIDWAAISAGHNEYFAGDGIHLKSAGKTAYSAAISEALYEYYTADLEKQRITLEEERNKLEQEEN